MKAGDTWRLHREVSLCWQRRRSPPTWRPGIWADPALYAGETFYMPSPFYAFMQVNAQPPSTYTVQAADTWASITQALYGTDDPDAIAALQSYTGTPVLTPGTVLTHLPASFSYEPGATATVQPYYVVQPDDTYTTITEALYGTSDPNAVTALENDYGDSPLTPGEPLGNPPTTLWYNTTVTPTTTPQTYTVQSGDTCGPALPRLCMGRATLMP